MNVAGNFQVGTPQSTGRTAYTASAPKASNSPSLFDLAGLGSVPSRPSFGAPRQAPVHNGLSSFLGSTGE